MKSISLMIATLIMATSANTAELIQKDVDVYGQNIHYAEAGNGPVVILLHGLWGGLNEWQPIIGPLSENNRLIVMDFIGFHGSDKPDVQYHNALLAEFLVGFIDALELTDVTLVGHAMGANAATWTAYHHPESVAALVLVDGAGYRNPERDLTQMPSPGFMRFRRVATGSSLAATRGLLERRVYDTSLITEAWVKEAFSLWVNSAKAIGDMLREGGDLTDEEMRQINVQTLVVWGAEDKVFSPDNTERLQSDIAGSEIHLIAQSGHLPQIEQTEAFLDAVKPFLNKLSGE
jgi:pimeloyl-ACP methyl ester carboxylesterase